MQTRKYKRATASPDWRHTYIDTFYIFHKFIMSTLLQLPLEILIFILRAISYRDCRNFSLVSKYCRMVVRDTPEIRYAHVSVDDRTVGKAFPQLSQSLSWRYIKSLAIMCSCSPHARGTFLRSDRLGIVETDYDGRVKLHAQTRSISSRRTFSGSNGSSRCQPSSTALWRCQLLHLRQRHLDLSISI